MQVDILPLEDCQWGVFANGNLLGKRADHLAATRLLQDVLTWLQYHPFDSYTPEWRIYAE